MFVPFPRKSVSESRCTVVQDNPIAVVAGCVECSKISKTVEDTKIVSERLKREAPQFGSFLGSVATTAYKGKVDVYQRKFDREILIV